MRKKIIMYTAITVLIASVLFVYRKETTEPVDELMISEVVTSNGSLKDIDGEYPDWIELYNSGENIVDLTGYYLSDDSQDPQKWRFPEIKLEPHQYMIVFASGKNLYEDGQLHTNFKIDCMGESLYLSDENGKMVCHLDVPEIPFDHSYGYSEEMKANLIFERGTPGIVNEEKVVKLRETAEIEYSLPAGWYAEEVLLDLQTTEKNAQIYYTLDGSIPNETSSVYSGDSLRLRDRSQDENQYTSIWTSPDDWDGQDGVTYNPNPQYKATVVKTRLYFPEEDTWSEKVWTNTYLIDAEYTLPIVSLSIQDEDFFDEDTGIYVPGKAYENYLATTEEIDPEPRNRTGNYSEDRKVLGYMEYFTENGSCVMENQVTMRICGNISRGSGMKSLTVYAWGNEQSGVFSYPVFGESCVDIQGNMISEFSSLRLRNFGNDWRRSKFRDALGQSLVTDLNMGTQGYQPCILLLNGEYFGLCEIRENRDEAFFEKHFGVENGNLEKVKIADIGKVRETQGQRDFLEFVEYMSKTDLSVDENYEYVESKLDVEQFMDYVLIQLYLQNIDWMKNNCDFFRAIVPQGDSANADGKWHVILYDVDYSINYEDKNNYEEFWESDSYCAVMMRSLLNNEECKERFVQRFEELLIYNFDTERSIENQQRMEEQMAPEIEEDLSRWTVYYNGELLKTTLPSYWYEKMEDLRRFFIERPEYARSYFYNSLP